MGGTNHDGLGDEHDLQRAPAHKPQLCVQLPQLLPAPSGGGERDRSAPRPLCLRQHFHRIGAFRTVYRPLDFFPEKKSQRQSSTSISAKDISAALSTTRQRHSPAAYKEMPDSSPTPTILPNCARCGCLEECMAASASSRSLLSTRS